MAAITFELNWGVIWTALALSAIYGTVKLLRQTITLTYVKKAVSKPVRKWVMIVYWEIVCFSSIVVGGWIFHKLTGWEQVVDWAVLVLCVGMRCAAVFIFAIGCAIFLSTEDVKLMAYQFSCLANNERIPLETIPAERTKTLKKIAGLGLYFLLTTIAWLGIGMYCVLIAKK